MTETHWEATHALLSPQAESLTVVSADGLSVPCELWVPPEGEDRGCGLVFLHGGSWVRGAAASYAEWGAYWAERGYAALAVDYRLADVDRPSWPLVLDDIAACVTTLSKAIAARQGEPDPPIGLVGDSAGAQLATMYSLDHRYRSPACLVLVYGIFDVGGYYEQCTDRPGHNPAELFLGATPHEDRAGYAAASPLEALAHRAAAASVPPSLVLWGDADEVVDPSQSARFVAAARAAGCTVQDRCFGGVGHYWFTRTPRSEGGGIDDWPNTAARPMLHDFLVQWLERKVGDAVPTAEHRSSAASDHRRSG